MIRSATAFAATCILSVASQADDHIVPDAFGSIQGAIDAAVPGDTVCVRPGFYNESLDFTGKDIVLRSFEGPSATTISGAGGTTVVIGPGALIEGFTIRDGAASFGAGMMVRGVGTVVRGNVFDSNNQGGGGFGAGIGGNSASPLIEGNVFVNNACDNQFLSGVVSFVNGSSPRIVNNLFLNNPCRGVNMTLPAGTNPEVLHNTFVGNGAAIRVDRRSSAELQSYQNNMIVGNEIGLEVDFGIEAFNPLWENNLVFGNDVDYDTITDQTGMAGNLAVDPMFVDPSADFRLHAGSPAIDAANNMPAGGLPTIDLDGNLRLVDGNLDGVAIADIGAFEFGLPVVALDFETEDDFRMPLVNGQDIQSSEEFGDLVAIDGVSATGLAAAIFDSTPGGPNAFSQDPDLLVGMGNVLILQRHPLQSSAGIYDHPNDDPQGGSLRFEFPAATMLLSLDLIDICPDAGQDVLLTLTDSHGQVAQYFVPSGWTEDITVDGGTGVRTLDLTILDPQPGFASMATALADPGFDPTRVESLTVRLSGSGALDNLRFVQPLARPSVPPRAAGPRPRAQRRL